MDTYAKVADALPPGCAQAHYARKANPKVATEAHAQAMLELAVDVYEITFTADDIQHRDGVSDEFTMKAIMGVFGVIKSRYESGRKERSEVRTEPGVLPVHKAMLFQCSASALASALELVSPSRNILDLPNTWFILIYVPITVLSRLNTSIAVKIRFSTPAGWNLSLVHLPVNLILFRRSISQW